MDITSYLLGKNSSGGGGGGSDLDWSAIGFSKEPDMRVEEGYDYAVEIKNSWRASTSLMNKYVNDYKLMFMPSVDTSTATNMQSMFRGCYCLKEIAQLDTSNVTDMSQMFRYNYNLNGIPLLNTQKATTMANMFGNCQSMKELPKLNTSNVTDMGNMLGGCKSLENVPILDTNKVTNMSGMFGDCYSLTDTSLDNILQMCINATSYTGTKKLKTLGFEYNTMTSIYNVARIQALPHYQDFINAGWTIS